MSHVVGVFIGHALSAARNSAAPIASEDELAEWATEQAGLILAKNPTPDQQLNCAAVICMFRGDPGNLIIAQARSGYLNSSEVAEWASDKQTIFMLHDAAFGLSKLPPDALDSNVLVVDSGWPGIYQVHMASPRGIYPGLIPEHLEHGDSLEERCAWLISDAWGLPRMDARRQLDEQIRVVQAYEDDHMDDEEMLSSVEDPNYPFREEVATEPTGERYIHSVTRLVRHR
jgi:hypothetical protein